MFVKKCRKILTNLVSDRRNGRTILSMYEDYGSALSFGIIQKIGSNIPSDIRVINLSEEEAHKLYELLKQRLGDNKTN